jgi:TPR repeat protein
LPEAQVQLGDHNAAALGTEEDLVTVYSWYEKAAEQGNSEAAARLRILRDAQAG